MVDFRRRFLAAGILALALLGFGAAGYMLLENQPFGDSLFMTAITLTAVGYREVFPLSGAGRVFTMGVLASGITWMGIWFALLTSFLVELDLGQTLRGRRILKRISSMKNHVIVCGVGRTGRQVIRELQDMGVPWVAIERDPDRAEAVLADAPDAAVLSRDATHDETLIEAGLPKARGLVACLSADTDNLFVCLSARDLKPDLTIVARAYEEATMDKLYRAGATHVVSPNVSGAVRMASVLLRPSVVSFLDIATRSSELSLRMEQAAIGSDSPVRSKTLAEARIPQATGLIVIALKKAGGEGSGFVFNPVADTRLEEHDELIVLGTAEQVEGLKRFLER
ncbi:MAG: potassium channel protein [Longimicrobiales bacterium]|nr:potassium channel protein [Longimicrobiales bacterium]